MKKILLLLFLFVFTPKINAEYFYYDDEKVDDMVITRSNGIATKSGNPYVLKRRSDNKFVYCIEPLNLINQQDEYIGYNYNDKIFELDEDKLNKINLIAYYGYNYANHTELKWYGITQYLIWKELYPNLDIYFTDERFGNKVSLYDDLITEINDLVNRALKGIDIKDEYEITTLKEYELIKDDLLYDYEVINNSSLKVEIVGNVLKVEAQEAGEYEFFLRRKKLDSSYYLYYNELGQNLFLPGIFENDLKISISVKTANLKLVKKDKNLNINNNITLKGAVYGLYDSFDNLIMESSTDSLGVINFKSLPLGTYKVKEISPSYGYRLDLEEHLITLDKDLEYTLYEERNLKKVTIKKTYNENNQLIAEENATFYLYRDGELIDNITTDEMGEKVLFLEYGEYRLVQVNGKEGYCYSDDYVFKIDENTDNLKIELVNEPLKDEIVYEVLGVKNTNKNYSYLSVIVLITLLMIKYAIR